MRCASPLFHSSGFDHILVLPLCVASMMRCGVVRFASPIRTRGVLRCCAAPCVPLSPCVRVRLHSIARGFDHILVLPLRLVRWLRSCASLLWQERSVLAAAAGACPVRACAVRLYSIAHSFVYLSLRLLRCGVGRVALRFSHKNAWCPPLRGVRACALCPCAVRLYSIAHSFAIIS
jgi:hypothetical protein